jgi:hypothetical protein
VICLPAATKMLLDPARKAANAVLQRLFGRIDIAQSGLFPLCKPEGLCYTQPGAKHWFALFLGSSVVEQPAVNRLVAGSNPARGAKPAPFIWDLRPKRLSLLARSKLPHFGEYNFTATNYSIASLDYNWRV